MQLTTPYAKVGPAGAICYTWSNGTAIQTAVTLKPGEVVTLGRDHTYTPKPTPEEPFPQEQCLREIEDFDPEYWVNEADLVAA